MSNKELTGRRRHRLGWLSSEPILILQVEETYLQTCHIAGQIETEWRKNWRDAHIGDLTVHELKEEENEKS